MEISHLVNTVFAFHEEEKIVHFSTIFPVQSIFCIKAKRRALLLANFLLDEKGALILERIKQIIEALKKYEYSINQDDEKIIEHFFEILHFFKEKPRLFTQMGLPLCHRQIEEWIQITLQLDRPLVDRDISWAILSALLCPLRQSIGSCFATAPAILIQKEYPGQCLQDLQALLSTGVLKRVISGVEFSVPMSPSPGLGDLKREILIEEAIASLPALCLTLSFAGIISKNMPFAKQVLFVQKLLHPFIGKKMNLLQLIEYIVRNHFSISEEMIQKDPFLTLPRSYGEEYNKVAEMFNALRLAKGHFIAFADHLLLKIWEFTVASLADVKMEFSRWNLFSSLGLHPQEKGGMGAIVYSHLEAKLQQVNQKLEHFQKEYDIFFDQVRATETLLRSAATEADVRRLKMEHYSRTYHLQACLEMRDKFAFEAEKIANFFPLFIEGLNTVFPQYFQEIYDPEMQEITNYSLDDSPAGFRLVYKHGRTHASIWTFIHSQKEWLQALRDFFLSIEASMKDRVSSEKEKELFSEIITAIVHYLNDPEFIKTAFLRMAKAHHITLRNIELEDVEKMEKKPWAYTSGGTILTLLKTYFRYAGSVTEMTRWVESPTDLCVFFLDTLKDLPPRIMNAYAKNKAKRMLVTSPTHVFSLLPGEKNFCEGWEHKGFTYTWIRDEIILPQQRFYHALSLDTKEQNFLIQKLSKKLPLLQAHQLLQSFTPSAYSLKPSSFFQMIRENHPYISLVLLESFFFESLPVQWDQTALMPLYREWEISNGFSLKLPLTRKNLHELFVKQIREKKDPYSFPRNIHEEIRKKMEKYGFAPPFPFLFADSNWAEIFFFAFLVSPATEEFALWRIDSQAVQGIPMRDWKQWIDGSHKTPWNIFSHSYQYSI